jgi:hypothetical protein
VCACVMCSNFMLPTLDVGIYCSNTLLLRVCVCALRSPAPDLLPVQQLVTMMTCTVKLS